MPVLLPEIVISNWGRYGFTEAMNTSASCLRTSTLLTVGLLVIIIWSLLVMG